MSKKFINIYIAINLNINKIVAAVEAPKALYICLNASLYGESCARRYGESAAASCSYSSRPSFRTAALLTTPCSASWRQELGTGNIEPGPDCSAALIEAGRG